MIFPSCCDKERIARRSVASSDSAYGALKATRFARIAAPRSMRRAGVAYCPVQILQKQSPGNSWRGMVYRCGRAVCSIGWKPRPTLRFAIGFPGSPAALRTRIPGWPGSPMGHFAGRARQFPEATCSSPLLDLAHRGQGLKVYLVGPKAAAQRLPCRNNAALGVYMGFRASSSSGLGRAGGAAVLRTGQALVLAALGALILRQIRPRGPQPRGALGATSSPGPVRGGFRPVRFDRASRCTLPINGMRVTPPSSSGDCRERVPSFHIFFSRSTR